MDRLRRDRRGYDELARVLRDMTGVTLPPSEKNVSLMAGRLGPLIRAHELDGYDGVLAALRRGDADVEREFIAVLTTHTTEFFRESAHFEILAKVVRERADQIARTGFRELRLWCAASSTGQEAYTLAMTLTEACPHLPPHALRILATDIDMRSLERGAAGVYYEGEMQSVPPLYKQKYFREWRQGKQRAWRVRPELSASVQFAPLNLTAPQLPFRHGFDVVVCRTVLSYFEKDEVQRVLGRLVGALGAGGHLFLGHSESGTLRSAAVESVATAVFRKMGVRA
jgi:chemotaxis protein methyltransferase CheR